MPRKRKTMLERRKCPSCERIINVFVYKNMEWKECKTCKESRK